MKRFIFLALCLLFVFMFCQPVIAIGENTCEINGLGYVSLKDALASVQNEDTITLLKNIEYSEGIVVDDKRITFDLNGYTLNVINDAEEDTIEEMSGLYVKGNSTVALEGEGGFNVIGSWYGVFAECNEDERSEVTVTNATGIERDGVAAQHSKVTVKGDVTSTGSTYSGVWASYENAEVFVEGNIYSNGEMSMGVNIDTLAVITVKGSVIVSGDNSIGINVNEKADVTVKGNITVSGDSSTGVYLEETDGRLSFVTINGEIIAPNYITIDSIYLDELTPFDCNYNLEISENYLYYGGYWGSYIYVSAHSGGHGSVDDPYLISNPTQLNAIHFLSRWGTNFHYKLVENIDLDGIYSMGEGWEPIGHTEVPFTGSFDGDGHTISNLCINRQYQNGIGLFGSIAQYSEIRNVGLINVDITGRHYVGGLVANNEGIITNSYVTGKVSGVTYVGGIIAQNINSITDSYFDGIVSQVKGHESDELYCAGGLIGYNYEEGLISECYSLGTVQSEGNGIGGFVGKNFGLITDSHAISSVTGYNEVGGMIGYNEGIVNNSYGDCSVTGGYWVGGLVGSNYDVNAFITNSYFTGTVSATLSFIGGLVGENCGGTISKCYTDNVTVFSTEYYVGGLVGVNIGFITLSYSTGDVTGRNYVGGLVGASHINLSGSGEILEEINSSYSICTVEGEMYVGGLVGYNEISIFGSFAKGDVIGMENDVVYYTYAGGLVGYNIGKVTDSYAWGDVFGHDMIGGLIGYNEADILNCYEIGLVTGENNTGGLIGFNLSGNEIIGSFWNNNTSGQDSSDGGTSVGSVTMKQKVTYVNENWDFNIIWGIKTSENEGYPFLRWQIDNEFAGGNGTEEDPYLILTTDHLDNVRKHLDKYFRQIADLDLSGYRSVSGWLPIGMSTAPFTGSYDGNGYTIENLFINQVGEWNNRFPAGLFGYTGAEAEILDLTIENVDITGCYYVGSLVGNNSGKIYNVNISGNVTGEWDTGGLVGFNSGLITECYFFGDVRGNNIVEYGDWTGGLVGYNSGGIISRCQSYVRLFSEGKYTGGLVGENLNCGIITESCSGGDITGGSYIGGLVGDNSGEITNCYSICMVIGLSYVGGLVGGNSGPISNSFSNGTVDGSYDVGGLVGSSTDSTIAYCYWDTETSGKSTSAGGIGKLSVEMKEQATYNNWNFITIFDIVSTFNDGYPFLRWQFNDSPVLSELLIDSLTDTTCELSFTTDKSGIYYYLVYTEAEEAPDIETIKSQGEATAKSYGIATDAINNVFIDELTALMAYKVYIILEYSEKNHSNIAVLSFTTLEGLLNIPSEPQNFTATPGDSLVVLSWTSPVSDGGNTITKYEVSKDNGLNWENVALNTSYTFTELTNGTVYTFKVRAVNSAGKGSEAITSIMPIATSVPDSYTITVQNDGNGTANANFITAASGIEITLTATPNSGYSFKTWMVLSGEITINNNKFIMPNQNVILKAVFEKNFVETPVYTIIEGADCYWSKDETLNTRIVCNGDIAKFIGVKVDNTLISSDKYIVDSGSTIITLDSEYLSTLSVGKHTVEFIYTDGSVMTNITILADISGQPDITLIVLLSIFGLLSATGIFGTILYVKKRRAIQ
ncbi:MAG: GLUG motif-containing protein [Bacilli bacterium]